MTQNSTRNALHIYETEIVSLYPILLGYARSITGDPHFAEDVLHDSLFKAWMHIDKYEPGSNPKSWMYRVIYHTFLESLKKRKRPIFTMTRINPTHSKRLSQNSPCG